jgi:hypothetical protein
VQSIAPLLIMGFQSDTILQGMTYSQVPHTDFLE